MWIIADHDSADKMVKFHQLKNLSMTDDQTAQWYIFAAFDTFTQTASNIGNVFQQLERGLLKTIAERPRVPHSIIFILGDSLLDDFQLMWNPFNLEAVLRAMFKQLNRVTQIYMDTIPGKAKPLTEIKLYVNKPLPKPERFFRNKQMEYNQVAQRRHTYNDKLVLVLREFGISFINPGISPADGQAFIKIQATRSSKADRFILSPQGLTLFWKSISEGLAKLHEGPIRNRAANPVTSLPTNHAVSRTSSGHNKEETPEEYFTREGMRKQKPFRRKVRQHPPWKYYDSMQ